MVSPKKEDKDRMFDEKPEYGQSLREFIRWQITTNSNYRERMQDEDRRARAIKELVSKWRKAQIDKTEYKEKSPDLYKQAIVKHSVDWFEDRIKKEMKEMFIPLKKHEQKKLPVSEAPTSKPRKKGKKTKQERRSRSTKKFLKKQKHKERKERKAKD
jgi:hypothetical protein